MSSDDIQKIKDRLGIEEVISDYIKLENAGKNLTAKCPFHNEKTPSFFVSPERGSYYCFGCGAKGDIFNFVQEFEGLDFVGALKVLASKAGIKLSNNNNSDSNINKKLFDLMEVSAKFLHENLLKNNEAIKYLNQRGLEEKTIKEWGIGFALNEWHKLQEYLLSKNFSLTEIEKVGLIKKGDKGNYYDCFRNRIMFPIFDSSGRVIAFSGRIFDSNSEEAKYINSPETPLFDKSETLYGLNFAKNHIRINNFSILVEGQFDIILAHVAGYKNTVASSGTAITERQLNKIKKISENLVIAYDSDNAGMKASERAWQIALSLGFDVKIAKISEGLDPADLILKDKKEWIKAIKESQNIIDFLVSRIILKEKDPRKKVLALQKEVLPYLALIKSQTEKSYYIRKISEEFGILEAALWQDLENVKELDLKKEEVLTSQNVDLLTLEKRLFGIYFYAKEKKQEDITSKVENELAEIFVELNDEFKSIASDLIFSVEAFYQNDEELKKDLDGMIKNVLLKSLKNKRSQIKNQIQETEKNNNIQLTSALLKEYQELSEKINGII